MVIQTGPEVPCVVLCHEPSHLPTNASGFVGRICGGSVADALVTSTKRKANTRNLHGAVFIGYLLSLQPIIKKIFKDTSTQPRFPNGGFAACGSCLPKKQNALAGGASAERASGCLIRRRLCRRWARGYAYPGSMLLLPARSFLRCDKSKSRLAVPCL